MKKEKEERARRLFWRRNDGRCTMHADSQIHTRGKISHNLQSQNQFFQSPITNRENIRTSYPPTPVQITANRSISPAPHRPSHYLIASSVGARRRASAAPSHSFLRNDHNDNRQSMHPFGGTPICPRCQKAVYAAEQVCHKCTFSEARA